MRERERERQGVGGEGVERKRGKEGGGGREREKERESTPTSMHDSPRVHMIKSTAQLDKVAPNGLLWNQHLLPFEVLHMRQ